MFTGSLVRCRERNRSIPDGQHLASKEDLLTIEARITSGEEELVPANVVERLIEGEPPLRVWREFRDLSQAALARAADVNRVQIVEIEAGRNSGSVHTLRKLADVLGVAVDDLIPVSNDETRD